MAVPVFGDIPGGVAGKDFDEIIHILWDKEYADELVRIFRHTLETGEPYIAPERAQFRIDRGVTEYYEWQLNRITLPDGSYGLVCYFRDISAQVSARKAIERSREALKEADHRKDEFLATLAHELRNPLAPIRNSLHILRMSGGDENTIEQLYEIMDRQVSHMVRLVDDLMEVSRITRGKVELRKEKVDLASIARTAVETSRPLVDSAKHTLDIELPSDPIVLDADPVRLAQVLSNLLNNAAKYTPSGGNIRLTVHREGERAVITVKDSGKGIPPQMLPKVFDLFVQIPGENSRSREGLGIGLTLVRRLVSLHGGDVEARSNGPGTGSEFVVSLPLAAESMPAPEPRRALEPVQHIAPQRILVVDDNFDSADSLGTLLRFLGSDVHIVNDGPQALEALTTYCPTLILLDIGLPGMDGYEVARRARQHPNGREIPLVALTGWGQEDDRRRSREAGIDRHLVKPADISTLEELLKSLSAKQVAI